METADLRMANRKAVQLYKIILRLHRGLPPEMQILGNSYVRDEFRRHKQINANEVDVFMTEWTTYAITLAKQLGIQGPKTKFREMGKPIDPKLLDTMRDDQIGQLYELMKAARDVDEK